MTDLQEVRRYWPKAKMSGQLLADGAAVWTVYAVDRNERQRIVVYADGMATVGKWVMTVNLQPTIHEAMRAAGFGARPQYAMKGYHFAAANRSAAEVRMIMRNWRAGTGRAPAPIERWVESLYRLPALVSTQRPRKGARLGAKKRREVGNA